jgi:hypothetical protein
LTGDRGNWNVADIPYADAVALYTNGLCHNWADLGSLTHIGAAAPFPVDTLLPVMTVAVREVPTNVQELLAMVAGATLIAVNPKLLR